MQVEIQNWVNGRFRPKGASTFATRTMTESGRFQLEMSVPTKPTRLVITSADASVYRALILSAAGDYPPLHAGTNKLGVICVSSEEAISGRILTASGSPVRGAEVSLVGVRRELPCLERSGSRTTTRSDGRFLLSGVPVGRERIQIGARGFLALTTTDFEVRQAEVSEIPTIRLSAASSLIGRVLDEHGQAIGGARIRGQAEDLPSRFAAECSSGIDGAFQLFVPQDGLQKVVATRLGYLPVEIAAGDPALKTGSRFVTLKMKRAPEIALRVEDATTGRALEAFELHLGESRAGGAFHRNGWTAHRFHPESTPVRVTRQGYVPYGGYIRPSADGEASEAVHTIRLRRAGSLSGRVWLAGKPVPFPLVRHQNVTVHGRRDGRFRFDGVDLGPVGPESESLISSVLILAEGAAPLELRKARLSGRLEKDLGDIELPRASTHEAWDELTIGR